MQRVVAALGALGETSIEERAVTRENVQFKLSAGLKKRG